MFIFSTAAAGLRWREVISPLFFFVSRQEKCKVWVNIWKTLWDCLLPTSTAWNLISHHPRMILSWALQWCYWLSHLSVSELERASVSSEEKTSHSVLVHQMQFIIGKLWCSFKKKAAKGTEVTNTQGDVVTSWCWCVGLVSFFLHCTLLKLSSLAQCVDTVVYSRPLCPWGKHLQFWRSLER